MPKKRIARDSKSLEDVDYIVETFRFRANSQFLYAIFNVSLSRRKINKKFYFFTINKIAVLATKNHNLT